MSRPDDNFFSRWSKRKLGAETPAAPNDDALSDAALPAAPGTPTAPNATHPAPTVAAPAQPAVPVQAQDDVPPLTLADVAELTRESDYGRFVARGVQPEVRNAALKKLFTDPHFNIGDGLDTYIDDYSLPDPLPEGMLRKMAQSVMLGLFDDETPPKPETGLDDKTLVAAADDATSTQSTETPAALSPPPKIESHEDTDLRLQQDNGAGLGSLHPGTGQDAGGQH